MSDESPSRQAAQWHGTTILSVRKEGKVVVAGDGQVSFGNTVIKSNARKVRRLGRDNLVIAGFAGATADAFTLFERLEAKLESHPGQLLRACVELAKDWRTDRYLRRLEAMMAVADAEVSLVITGIGLSPEYVFEARAGETLPDNKRFGVFWMNYRAVAVAYNLDGAFNDFCVDLAPGAAAGPVLAEMDRLLAPYGAFGAYTRRDHPSAQRLDDEIRVHVDEQQIAPDESILQLFG